MGGLTFLRSNRLMDRKQREVPRKPMSADGSLALLRLLAARSSGQGMLTAGYSTLGTTPRRCSIRNVSAKTPAVASLEVRRCMRYAPGSV